MKRFALYPHYLDRGLFARNRTIMVAGLPDLSLLNELGKTSGVVGITLGVVVVTFRSIIVKLLFPKLSQVQAFRLMRLIAILAWSLGLAGIGIWAYSLRPQPNGEQVLSGFVEDMHGKGIFDALVQIRTEGLWDKVQDRTTTRGGFRLLMTNLKSPVRIRIIKEGYSPWEDWVVIPQTEYLIKLALASVPESKVGKGSAAQSKVSHHPAQPEQIPAKPADQPTWDQIRADLVKSYVNENFIEVNRLGTLACDTEQTKSYCRQLATITIQNVDFVKRCYTVTARYSLVANQWHFDGMASSVEGCSG